VSEITIAPSAQPIHLLLDGLEAFQHIEERMILNLDPGLARRAIPKALGLEAATQGKTVNPFPRIPVQLTISRLRFIIWACRIKPVSMIKRKS
jgi:hypothetical protein